jgi:hypothetical protein
MGLSVFPHRRAAGFAARGTGYQRANMQSVRYAFAVEDACRLTGTLQWVPFCRASDGKWQAFLAQETPVLGLDPLENQLLIETLSSRTPSLAPHPLGCVAFTQNP